MMHPRLYRFFSALLLLGGAVALSGQDLSHRQSTLQVQVTSTEDEPLSGAVVTVDMVNHAFRFGTALEVGEINEGGQGYDPRGIAAIQDYFNSVTYGNNMKWTYVENRSDEGSLELVADVYALRAFDSDFPMRLRGHTTVWGAQYQLPTDLQAMTDPAQVKTRIRNHVTDYHTLFRGQGIDNFDLYNEHFHERQYIIEKAVPGSTISTMIAEQAAEVAEWFKAAVAADPEAMLFINEYNILNFWQENDSDVIAYKNFVDAVRDAGGPVHGIGLQAHMDRFITKEQIKRRLDILAAPMAPTTNHPEGLPGLRIEVTELDINTQWWTTATAEQQAQVTANVLDACFEHPSVDGVTMWGMRDTLHWRDNSILIDDTNDANWVIKPSGQAWIDRVKGTWWTDLAGTTDTDGSYSGTVFKGQHRITVTYDGETQTFVRDLSADQTLTVEFDTTPPDTSNSYLTNLSVRAPLADGQTMSLGFVVDGGSKDVLVRAGGPVLNQWLSGAMEDPRFYVQWDGVESGSNDDWDAATLRDTSAALGATSFADGSPDAAALVTVAGPNTVEITGTSGGIVLGEVYDAAAATTGPRLSNISARSRTAPGVDILTAGFYVGGTGQARLLIRGVGPTLGTLGVPGVVADPRITVFTDGNEEIASNDDWDPSLQSVMDAVGAIDLDAGSKDAALVVVVDAGRGYTVQVIGADGAETGVALIEVYEVR